MQNRVYRSGFFAAGVAAAIISAGLSAPVTALATTETTGAAEAAEATEATSILELQSARDLNAIVLRTVREMPRGGGYSLDPNIIKRLGSAVRDVDGVLRVFPAEVMPSFCTVATYFVFLRVLEKLQDTGELRLSPETRDAYRVQEQPDGTGVWGRWNANGPGTGRLFYQLGLGRSFNRLADARPGDFMKIFWNGYVGKRESGHSVVYLGTRIARGKQWIRVWSSNQKDCVSAGTTGYCEREVDRATIKHAIFTRLERPAAAAKASALEPTDAYLASLLTTASSFAEADRMAGINR